MLAETKCISTLALKIAGLSDEEIIKQGSSFNTKLKVIRRYNQLYAIQFQEESIQYILRESTRTTGRECRQIQEEA